MAIRTRITEMLGIDHPIVQGGMMFFTAPPSIYKINLKTGETVWKFDTGGGGRGGGGGGPRGGGR